MPTLIPRQMTHTWKLLFVIVLLAACFHGAAAAEDKPILGVIPMAHTHSQSWCRLPPVCRESARPFPLLLVRLQPFRQPPLPRPEAYARLPRQPDLEL